MKGQTKAIEDMKKLVNKQTNAEQLVYGKLREQMIFIMNKRVSK